MKRLSLPPSTLRGDASGKKRYRATSYVAELNARPDVDGHLEIFPVFLYRGAETLVVKRGR
jgi:hypothetical protein